MRIERPPRIDGRLDDPAWAAAARIERFVQVEPVEGAPPSERTVVLVAYDARALYFGIRCYERDPAAIVARQLAYDVDMTSDDRVNIVLDTFFDRRNGYFFQINPLGTRGDARIESSRIFRREWDGVWYGKARIDAQGWTAEIAIPFQTIAFDPRSTRWGLQIQRRIRRLDEDIRWADPSRNRSIVQVGRIGILEGLEGLEQGLGIDARPALALRAVRDGAAGDRDLLGRPSLDLFYRVTPSLVGALTVATDFTEAPADERQVNLGRFSLFFPETRDFFLEDAGLFEFAGIENNGRPFFSRRIGLDPDGEPVPLRAGAKLAGRIGPWRVGALAVRTGAHDGVPRRALAVARLEREFLEESSVGAIATAGDPWHERANRVGGVDLRLRTSRFRGDRVLEGRAWYVASDDAAAGRDDAFGLALEYPNDRLRWELAASEIGARYAPALGFVNRAGIRELRGSLRLRARPEGGLLRTVDVGLAGSWIGDLEGRTEDGSLEATLLDLRTQAADRLRLSVLRVAERLDEPHEPVPGVPIPAGRHVDPRGRVLVETSNGRPVAAKLDVTAGQYATGRLLDWKAALELRPVPQLFAALEWEQTHARLASGRFVTRLVRLRLDLRANPDLAWLNLLQYDNASDTVGVQSRLRWILEPGRELFLVFEYGARTEGGRLETLGAELAAKGVMSVRF